MKNKFFIYKNRALSIMLSCLLAVSSGPVTGSLVAKADTGVTISLSDSGTLVDGSAISSDSTSDVFVTTSMDNGGTTDTAAAANVKIAQIVNINKAGTYNISGELTEGQIAVNANDISGNVYLNLQGASVKCASAPAIFVYGTDPTSTDCTVTISTAEGTTNNITGGKLKTSVYQWTDQSSLLYYIDKGYDDDDGSYYERYKYDGAISSDISLTFSGSGVLNVTSTKKEGIESKQHLTFNGGTINISSKDDAVNASMDNVSIITINDGTLIAKVSNDADEGDGIDSNGTIYINGGTVYGIAHAGSDNGIDADNGIYVTGGTVFSTGDMLEQGLQTTNSTPIVQMTLSSALSSGDTLAIVDSSSNVIFAYETDRSFSAFSYTSPSLSSTETYTVYSGTAVTGTTDSLGVYTEVTSIDLDSMTTQTGSSGQSGPGGSSSGGESGQCGPGGSESGQGGTTPGGSSDADVTYTGSFIVTDTQILSGQAYSSSTSDESAVWVMGGGNLTLSNSTDSKTAGDSSDVETSEFYGVNAAFLVTSGSAATITGANITTAAKGANAVFATGENATIKISDSTITSTASSSARGLDATYGGTIEADNVTITTQGGSCATLATDRGSGTVTASNSTLTTNGSGSPVIYSTGDITVKDGTTGTANGAQLVVVEGKNSASVIDSTLYAAGTGNRGTTDSCGVMIYQSMSGDAETGTGNFTAKNASLNLLESSSYYTTAPFFFITNTDAVINLTNTEMKYGSGILLDAEGTSEWGTSGSNGGNVTLNGTNQTLSGAINADNISTLTIALTNSAFTGSVNSANTAKKAALTIDSTTTLTLTADTYLTSFTDEDSTYSNVTFNGYKLYVNGTAVDADEDDDTDTTISSVKVLNPDDICYTGKAVIPEIAVTNSKGKVLTANVDYKVRFQNNRNVGSKAKITVTGKGKYSGKIITYFTINRADISGATVRDLTLKYTGRAQRIKPVVILNGKKLSYNRDYTVTYENNIDLGTTTLTIVGKKNYEGTAYGTLVITNDSLMSKAKVSSIRKQVYTGSEITPAVTVTYGSGRNKVTLTENVDYTVTYENNTEIGTASVIITAVEGSGYAGYIEKTFRIAKK